MLRAGCRGDVTCVVPVREHHVQVKGDFLGVARKGDFLSVVVIGGANVGADAVGPPIRFNERWDEVLDIVMSDIAAPEIPRRPASPPPATPPAPESAPVMAQAASEPHEHYTAHREFVRVARHAAGILSSWRVALLALQEVNQGAAPAPRSHGAPRCR